MTRLGILISGRGSNFVAIADNIRSGKLKAEIAIVISNREDAAGIAAAEARGLKTVVLPSKAFKSPLLAAQTDVCRAASGLV